MQKWILALVFMSAFAHANDPHSNIVHVVPEVVKDPARATTLVQEPTKSHEETAGVDAEKALGWLKNGNKRYLKRKLRADGQNQTARDKLATGQHPHTIVLSCSDSRVPPELIFDQKLGEIFVIRTAGESLDNSAIASIEYAVAHLGPQLLLVMGHTSCGAVKAALSTMKGEDAGSPALNYLVKDLHPHLASYKDKTPTKNVFTESNDNALGVAKDLVSRSQIIANAVKDGKLTIKTSVYNIESGVVNFNE